MYFGFPIARTSPANYQDEDGVLPLSPPTTLRKMPPNFPSTGFSPQGITERLGGTEGRGVKKQFPKNPFNTALSKEKSFHRLQIFPRKPLKSFEGERMKRGGEKKERVGIKVGK